MNIERCKHGMCIRIIRVIQTIFRRKTQQNRSHWCLVGNIIAERPYGPGGHEKRSGTKHFSPDTKVYCLPVRWGDGYERITVIGRHRGSKRFVTMVVQSKWITNWRAKEVYQPEVLRRIQQEMSSSSGWPWRSKKEVEQYVRFLQEQEEL